MPQHILYIIAEDPEVQHIAADVKKTPVYEHGGEQRNPGGPRCTDIEYILRRAAEERGSRTKDFEILS